MKKIILTTLMLGAFLAAISQSKYITQKGFISFFSRTPIEDISADNNEVGSIINTETGEMIFKLKMTNFQFEKKLMQQHFNENYVESDKFPTSSFKGFITNNEQVDYTTQGSYSVYVEGDLTIHGVTNRVQIPGTIEVTPDGLKAFSKFIIKPADYDIKIPKIVRNKIAREMEITVKMDYTPM